MIQYDPSITYTVAQLADHWHCKPSTVYGMIKTGKLQAFKVGVGYRVTDKALREFEEGVSA